MRDLIQELKKAQSFREGWNTEALYELIDYFKKDNPLNSIMWAEESGQDVCSFIVNRRTLMAYVHVKFPICFAADIFKKYKKRFADKLWIVSIEDFDKDEWCVDLEEMEWTAPEIQWMASVEAVNPESFSIDGFRFATE